MAANLATFTASIACSTACIAYLGLSDPKRRGVRGSANAKLSRKRVLGLIGSLAPGLWLLVQLEGAYFLMWFGYVAVLGWAIALILQKRGA
ncbi:MAG: hypothetical protein AAF441_13310 [Pseudomonadota bacterium]